MFGTVDTGKGWKSQVCPRAIGGITTCHKMRHSLSLPTVTYICMGELPHFHHSPTTSFLHSQPIQAPPSGPGLVCAAGQMFIWDDPSTNRIRCFTSRTVLLPTSAQLTRGIWEINRGKILVLTVTVFKNIQEHSMKFKNIRGYSNGKIKFKNIQDFRRPVRTLIRIYFALVN